MWTKLNAFLTDQRFQAMFAGFVLSVITQLLSLLSHKLGLDPETAAKLPGIANVLTAAIGAFTIAFVGAHAHAEHGENVGNGLAAGLQAGGEKVEAALLGGALSGAAVAVAVAPAPAPVPAPTDPAKPA